MIMVQMKSQTWKSRQVYVKGPDNPYPKSVQAEIVDVDDPTVNRQ